MTSGRMGALGALATITITITITLALTAHTGTAGAGARGVDRAQLVFAFPVSTYLAATAQLPDRGDTTSALPDVEAAADSVGAFWRGVDEGWLDRMDADLEGFGLGAAALDSLTAEGDAKLDDLAAGRLWDFDMDWFSRQTFNRVQSLTLGLGMKIAQAGPNRPTLYLGASYRFGTKRPLFDAAFEVPLIVRHRWLPRDLGRGRPYRLLSLELDGYQKMRAFGGDDRTSARAWTSLIYGSDPNQYYEAWGGVMRLWYDTGKRLKFYGALRWEEHRQLAVTTDFNLFNWSLSPPGNLPAANLRDRAARLGFYYRTRGRWLDVRGNIGWHRVDQSSWLSAQPGMPESDDFRRIGAHATLNTLTGWGHRVILSGHYREVDRRAPLQWKTYLGDYNTLRGYQHAEIVGDRGAWAALDIRWDWDLWRALRVPWLKNLGLQPVTFMDWGETWDHAGDAPSYGSQGWRADAGIGFGKLLGAPGLQGNLRLYVARPVLDGVGRDWRVLLAFEN